MPVSRYDFDTAPEANPAAIISGRNFRFTVLTDGVLRYEWAADGLFEDRASTFAIFRRFEEPVLPDFEASIVDNVLTIVTARLRLSFDLTAKSFTNDSLSVELVSKQLSKTWRYGDAQADNLGGTIRTLDGVNGRSSLGHGVCSRSGIATIDDSDSFLFDGSGWIASRREGHRVDGYVFAFGHDYQEAVRDFYRISGRQPLLPRWALGNWWSHYHAYSDSEYLALMDRFRRHQIPLTVGVMDMDWHLVNIDPKYGAGWTGYTWNRDLIRSPVNLLSELHQRKLKVTLNDHPALGVRAFEEKYSEFARAMGVDPLSGESIDFDCTNQRYVDSFFDVISHDLERQGVDFWWIDWQQGTRSNLPNVDPLWVLNHYHYLDNSRNHRRGLNFSRFAGPGSQRYPIGFSGDTHITWRSLNFQPEFTVAASNIGYTQWSHDIGGHTHGYRDDELTVRWVQFGCFSPILRLHYSSNPFISRKPWELSLDADAAMTEFMRFRHRLIPYLYSMNVRSNTVGEPLVQPLYWKYPEEDEAYKHPNEYLFGSQMLVAPITEPRDQHTQLGRTETWLPDGHFVDLFNGIVYSGGRKVVLHRPLSECPALAPSGAIIPLNDAEDLENGDDLPDSILVLLVVGRDGSFDLHEDDGRGSHVRASTSPRSQSSLDDTLLNTTRLVYKQITGELHIIQPSHPIRAIPANRNWTIRVLSCTSIPLDTITSSLVGPDESTTTLPSSTVKTSAIDTLIDLGRIPNDVVVRVKLGPHPYLTNNDVVALSWRILFNSHMLFNLKADIWRAINSHFPLDFRWKLVQDLRVPPPLLEALKEVWFADGTIATAASHGDGAVKTSVPPQA